MEQRSLSALSCWFLRGECEGHSPFFLPSEDSSVRQQEQRVQTGDTSIFPCRAPQHPNTRPVCGVPSPGSSQAAVRGGRAGFPVSTGSGWVLPCHPRSPFLWSLSAVGRQLLASFRASRSVCLSDFGSLSARLGWSEGPFPLATRCNLGEEVTVLSFPRPDHAGCVPGAILGLRPGQWCGGSSGGLHKAGVASEWSLPFAVRAAVLLLLKAVTTQSTAWRPEALRGCTL
ncbi:neurocalcin-delta isoform X2 [Cavia porcellus]